MNIGQLIATLGITTVGMDAAQASVTQLANKVNATMGVTQKMIDATAAKMQAFGRSASMYMTVPIALAGGAALSAAKDFEFSMQKITGLVGESQQQVDAWSKDILALGPALGRSPKELADALYFVTSSGFSGSEALDIMTRSAKAASAGLGDTKAIADLSTSAMAAYASSNLSSAQVLDVLTAAVREGKGEATDFAKQIGDVIPIASKMGVSFDQVAGAISMVTLTGQKVSEVVTGLRQALFEIQKPAAGSTKTLEMMGTSIETLQNSLRSNGLLATLKDLDNLTQKYGVGTLEKIFPNIRAYNNILSLLGDRYEKNVLLQKEVTNSTGSLDRAFSAVGNTLEFKYNQAMSSVQASLIELGMSMKESIIPLMESFSKTITSLVHWYTSLSTNTQQLILKTALLLAVIGPISITISVLIKTFSGLYTSIIFVSNAMKVLWGVMLSNPITATLVLLGAIATAMYAISRSSNSAAKSQRTFNDEFEKSRNLQLETSNIEEQMAVISSLNKDQVIALKQRIEEQIKLNDTYQAEILGKTKKLNDDLLKEENKHTYDLEKTQVQENSLITAYTKGNLKKYLDAKENNEKTTKSLTDNLAIVEKALANFTGKKPKITIDIEMNESIQSTLSNVAAEEKYITLMSNILGESFDTTSEKAQLYGNSLKALAKIKGIGIDNKAIKEVAGKLSSLNLTAIESEKRVIDLGNELTYLDMKAEIMGSSFDLAGEQLKAYNDTLEKAIRSGKASSLEIQAWKSHVVELTKAVVLNDKTLQHQLATIAYENAVLSDGWDVTASEKAYNTLNNELQAYIAEMQRLNAIKINSNNIVDPEIDARLTDVTDKVKLFQNQLNAMSAKQFMVENLANAFSTVASALGNVSTAAELMGGSMGKVFESITQWISLIGSTISSVQEIVKLVNTLTLASKAQTTANATQIATGTAQTTVNTAVAASTAAAIAPTATLTAASSALAVAYKNVAVSGALAASSWVPFPGNIAAMTTSIATLTTEMAAGMAAAAALSVPGLAEGGVIPAGYPNDTYPAMLTSGETVVPPGKLDSIRSQANQSLSGNVKFKIQGYDLIGVIQKQTKKNKIV